MDAEDIYKARTSPLPDIKDLNPPKEGDPVSTPGLGGWIVVAGDVVDGLMFIGPFHGEDEAILWATDHCIESWLVSPVVSTKGYLDDD